MLQKMNLSNNAIVHGNKIKTVEQLNANVQLEYFNLSGNCIVTNSDISMLKNPKVSRNARTEETKKRKLKQTNGMLFLLKLN